MALRTLREIHKLQKKAGSTKTPYLVLDLENIQSNCRAYREAFQDAIIFYAVKANSCPAVLKIVHQGGIRFDVASWGEIEYLKEIGVPAEKIVFSAPTKIPEHIQLAYESGVRLFAFDSQLELEKIAELAPGSKVAARLIVKNTGSEWPLERKFGMHDDESFELMIRAKELGLIPWMITFHVGSQNLRPETWAEAMRQTGELEKRLEGKNIRIGMVNAGGGMPAQYFTEIPSLQTIAEVILKAKKQFFDRHVKLCVEPGRGLVAEAGIMVSTVINRTIRDGENWLYLDAGIFQGLYEAHEGIRFPILTEKEKDSRSEYIVAGPSCDSVDIIMENISLPSTLTVGDRVYIQSTGAYTTSVERYNGLDYPSTQVVGCSS